MIQGASGSAGPSLGHGSEALLAGGRLGAEIVARHRRSYIRVNITYDPLHYPSLLEKKPGTLHLFGLFLVHQMMDQVEYRWLKECNIVPLTKRQPKTADRTHLLYRATARHSIPHCGEEPFTIRHPRSSITNVKDRPRSGIQCLFFVAAPSHGAFFKQCRRSGQPKAHPTAIQNKLIGSRSNTDTIEKFRSCRFADGTKCTRNDIKLFSADLLTLM